jgi:hypothetical protein
MKKIQLALLSLFIGYSTFAQTKKMDTLAVSILDRMSDVIGELSSVSFTIKTRTDEMNQDLGLITHFTTNQVYFNGPNQMLVRAENDKENKGYWYNGKQLVYYSFSENNYAVIETPETTIEMIDEVNDKYGVDFPAADFFYPTFTDNVLKNYDELKFAGLRKIEGKDCFYVIARNKEMSVQLWITNDAYTLPVKMIIMYHSTKNDAKQYEANFSNWEINPFLPEVIFNFQPPPNAKEILIKPRK